MNTSKVTELISDALGGEQSAIEDSHPLMSGETPIDSVVLVEICVRLEDYAFELGFEFDWMSEDAMSRSRSIFRTAGSLCEEFARQMSASSE